MKTVLIMLAVSTAMLSAPSLNAQPPEHQRMRIMIGQENGDRTPGMQFVSASLSSSLAKYCGTTCVVVEPSESDDTLAVDAYLRGNVGMMQRCSECRPYMQGAMRLVAKDGTVLWSDTVRSDHFARSATSR